MTRKHLIRQAVLQALTEIYPGGRSLERLAAAPDVVAIQAQEPELIGELGVLEAAGMIVDIRKGRVDGAFYKATLTGMLQIRREAPLDEIVWGEGAL